MKFLILFSICITYQIRCETSNETSIEETTEQNIVHFLDLNNGTLNLTNAQALPFFWEDPQMEHSKIQVVKIQAKSSVKPRYRSRKRNRKPKTKPKHVRPNKGPGPSRPSSNYGYRYYPYNTKNSKNEYSFGSHGTDFNIRSIQSNKFNNPMHYLNFDTNSYDTRPIGIDFSGSDSFLPSSGIDLKPQDMNTLEQIYHMSLKNAHKPINSKGHKRPFISNELRTSSAIPLTNQDTFESSVEYEETPSLNIYESHSHFPISNNGKEKNNQLFNNLFNTFDSEKYDRKPSTTKNVELEIENLLKKYRNIYSKKSQHKADNDDPLINYRFPLENNRKPYSSYKRPKSSYEVPVYGFRQSHKKVIEQYPPIFNHTIFKNNFYKKENTPVDSNEDYTFDVIDATQINNLGATFTDSNFDNFNLEKSYKDKRNTNKFGVHTIDTPDLDSSYSENTGHNVKFDGLDEDFLFESKRIMSTEPSPIVIFQENTTGIIDEDLFDIQNDENYNSNYTDNESSKSTYSYNFFAETILNKVNKTLNIAPKTKFNNSTNFDFKNESYDEESSMATNHKY